MAHIRDRQPARFSWARATIENGANASRRTTSAADYFVDEDAAAMLEYVGRLKRSD